jgi:ligand-binding sensor domain-containing protein
MKRWFFIPFSVMAWVMFRSCAAIYSEPQERIAPPGDTVWTSTREITCLAVAPDGALWAGTTGGVLRFERDGRLQKWTKNDGLPAHEVRDISFDGATVHVQFPNGEAIWRDNTWNKLPTSGQKNNALRLAQTSWRGAHWSATLQGLQRDKSASGQARTIGLPPSSGTHISALLPRGNVLWTALFGDGLWQFDGKQWSRVALTLPAPAREVTALAADDATKVLYVGTRHDGVWKYQDQQWKQWLAPDEPLGHNAQFITSYNGELWYSTLESGLCVRTAQGWKYFDGRQLSSPAPRQLVNFKGALWVRHGNGRIDKWDGVRWTRNVFPYLPRQKAFSLASDGGKLYIGQWGGWSEWDGKIWEHFLRLPQLQGIGIMTLLPEDDRLWLGTQNRGLVEAQRVEVAPQSQIVDTSSEQTLLPSLPSAAYQLRVHDERLGLPDDWITAIERQGQALWAGTFVGGLARFDGKRWHALPELRGENVTALASRNGGLWITTRRGLWHRDAQGKLRRINDKVPFLDTENQALFANDKGLWIGSRTGMFWMTNSTIQITLMANAPEK